MPRIADHEPQPLSGTCLQCGLPVSVHRVEHAYKLGCCKLPEANHRSRKRKSRYVKKPPRPKKEKPLPIFWGIDGEGQGRAPHRYTLLAAVSELGEREYIEGNITTERALDFILNLPTKRLFAYSFGYDLTKILADLPDYLLYSLVHEDERPSDDPKRGPRPVYWKARSGKVYALNLQRTKFTVRLCRFERRLDNVIAMRGKGQPRSKTVVIWDIWKFFQGKFVSALKAWGIGTLEELERMAEMKDQRARFDELDHKEVRSYCFDECEKIARLAKELTLAHQAAGLKLTSYYGAGSSASAMLKLLEVKTKRGHTPKEMQGAVTRAFFGGRFENAAIGSVPGPVYGYDIASAYPYELFHLPCLEHAQWVWTKRRADVDKGRHALVRYSLGQTLNHDQTWAPFPWRDDSGSICFPISSDGGWVYRDEFLAGERLFPNVQFREAYVLHSDCDCRPFKRIAEWYRERKAIGGSTRGIVLKLGMNSCYGKLAQSLGIDPPYQSWLWAGMITSGTRAQILGALGRLSSHDQLLMVATDGILTREKIEFPAPRDTGTSDLAEPLGAWTCEEYPRGVFCARPGIYFPLEPTEKDLKRVRARGIGKALMHEAWRSLKAQYEAGKPTATIEPSPVRFMGIKSSIHQSAAGFKRSGYYGEWIERPLEISFDPLPKRERVSDDGVSLLLRSVKGLGESRAYSKAIGQLSPEAIELAALEQERDEQADGGDYAEY